MPTAFATPGFMTVPAPVNPQMSSEGERVNHKLRAKQTSAGNPFWLNNLFGDAHMERHLKDQFCPTDRLHVADLEADSGVPRGFESFAKHVNIANEEGVAYADAERIARTTQLYADLEQSTGRVLAYESVAHQVSVVREVDSVMKSMADSIVEPIINTDSFEPQTTFYGSQNLSSTWQTYSTHTPRQKPRKKALTGMKKVIQCSNKYDYPSRGYGSRGGVGAFSETASALYGPLPDIWSVRKCPMLPANPNISPEFGPRRTPSGLSKNAVHSMSSSAHAVRLGTTFTPTPPPTEPSEGVGGAEAGSARRRRRNTTHGPETLDVTTPPDSPNGFDSADSTGSPAAASYENQKRFAESFRYGQVPILQQRALAPERRFCVLAAAGSIPAYLLNPETKTVEWEVDYTDHAIIQTWLPVFLDGVCEEEPHHSLCTQAVALLMQHGYNALYHFVDELIVPLHRVLSMGRTEVVVCGIDVLAKLAGAFKCGLMLAHYLPVLLAPLRVHAAHAVHFIELDEEVAELKRTGMYHKQGPEVGGVIYNASYYDAPEESPKSAAAVPDGDKAKKKDGTAQRASTPVPPVAGKTSIGPQLLGCLRAIDLNCGKGVVPTILKYIPSYRPKVVKKGSLWKDRIKLTPKDRMSEIERKLYGHSATIHDSNSTPFTIISREEREAKEKKRADDAKKADAAARKSGSKTDRAHSPTAAEAKELEAEGGPKPGTPLEERTRSFLDVRSQTLLLRRPPIPLNHGVRPPGSSGTPFLHRFKQSSQGLMSTSGSGSEAGEGPMPTPQARDVYKDTWPWVAPYVDEINQAAMDRAKRGHLQ